MISLLQVVLLFGAGAYAAFAVRAGLGANAGVALVVGLWLGSLLYRRNREDGVVVADPPPPDVIAREAERGRLRSILDHAPVPLLTMSFTGSLRAENRAARALFRCDDVISAPPAGLAGAMARGRPGERTILKFADPATGDGERSFALSVATSAGPDGPLLLAALVDIQAELQAIEATTLRELLQTLSHEIMNSLTPVNSLAESALALLSEGAAGSRETAIDALETIVRRASGLDRFVHGYRMLARLPPPVLRASSVSALLNDAAVLFRSRWGGLVGLEIVLPAPDLIVKMDADLVMQALMNLMSNAADAALSGPVQPGVVRVSAGAANARLVLRVGDSGPGVAADNAETIFRPFFTLKAGGTGIGLSLARQIAQSHGGDLTLDPPCDSGASFTLTI